MSAREITMTLTESEIRRSLSSRIIGPDSDILVDNIISNCESEIQLGNLFKALQGIIPKIEDYGFIIGELIYVKISTLSSWKWDKAKMIDNQLIIDETLECRITAFEPNKENPIKVSFSYINDDGKLITDTQFARIAYMMKSC